MTPGSHSIRYYLKNAFEYEIRNRLEPRMIQLNAIDELDEEEADELRLLKTIEEYLHKRIGEMQV